MKGGSVSKEGDVFTFAMVAVEVCSRGVPGRSSRIFTLHALAQTFTGRPPFVVNYNAAVLDILNGKRPGRPPRLVHEGLWNIMTRSWSETPSERPTAVKLLEFFQESWVIPFLCPVLVPIERLLGSQGDRTCPRYDRFLARHQPGVWRTLRNIWMRTPSLIRDRPDQTRKVEAN